MSRRGKPAWDATVNDLTSLRLAKNDLERKLSERRESLAGGSVSDVSLVSKTKSVGAKKKRAHKALVSHGAKVREDHHDVTLETIAGQTDIASVVSSQAGVSNDVAAALDMEWDTVLLDNDVDHGTEDVQTACQDHVVTASGSVDGSEAEEIVKMIKVSAIDASKPKRVVGTIPAKTNKTTVSKAPAASSTAAAARKLKSSTNGTGPLSSRSVRPPTTFRPMAMSASAATPAATAAAMAAHKIGSPTKGIASQSDSVPLDRTTLLHRGVPTSLIRHVANADSAVLGTPLPSETVTTWTELNVAINNLTTSSNDVNMDTMPPTSDEEDGNKPNHSLMAPVDDHTVSGALSGVMRIMCTLVAEVDALQARVVKEENRSSKLETELSAACEQIGQLRAQLTTANANISATAVAARDGMQHSEGVSTRVDQLSSRLDSMNSSWSFHNMTAMLTAVDAVPQAALLRNKASTGSDSVPSTSSLSVWEAVADASTQPGTSSTATKIPTKNHNNEQRSEGLVPSAVTSDTKQYVGVYPAVDEPRPVTVTSATAYMHAEPEPSLSGWDDQSEEHLHDSLDDSVDDDECPVPRDYTPPRAITSIITSIGLLSPVIEETVQGALLYTPPDRVHMTSVSDSVLPPARPSDIAAGSGDLNNSAVSADGALSKENTPSPTLTMNTKTVAKTTDNMTSNPVAGRKGAWTAYNSIPQLVTSGTSDSGNIAVIGKGGAVPTMMQGRMNGMGMGVGVPRVRHSRPITQ